MGDLVELSTFKLTQRTIPLKELRKWKLFNTIGDSFLENVRVAHAHKQFGFLVTTDDNVCAFGTGIDGSLGLGSIKQASTPIKINALCGQTVKEFVFGNTGNQCFAITADGRVFGWGINSNGLLGIGTDDKTISTPTLLKFDEGVKIAQISVGLCHALALSLDTAEVFAWGHPLGVGSDIDLNKPCKITTNLQNIKVKQISCGEFTSFVLSESEDVYSWGYNKEGQLGIANTASANVPTKLVIDKLIKKIANGHKHTLLLTTSGQIYVCGCNAQGQLGTGNTTNLSVPTKLSANLGFIDDISVMADQSSAKSANGIFVWGKIYPNGIFTSPTKLDSNFSTFPHPPAIFGGTEQVMCKSLCATNYAELPITI